MAKSKKVGKLSKNQFICLGCPRSGGKVKKVTGVNVRESHRGKHPCAMAKCPKCNCKLRKFISKN